MKMNVSVAFVGLFLVASIALQGCSSPWGSKDDKEKKDDEEEVTAQCNGGGNFSCSGPWRKWCAQQEKKCMGVSDHSHSGESCTPQCTWECEKNRKCDQDCAPKCGQALCSTRCKNFNTQSCQMKCGSPNCKVVCPKHFCPGQNCAACKTECGKPVCKMQCNKPDAQPCRHVCAEPRCKWECKKPTECPKPICHMKCQKPRDCMDNTHMVPKLPPLEPGETEVSAFHTKEHAGAGGAPSPGFSPAPAARLLQSATSVVHGHASTMRVDITTMGTDFKLQRSQVDLQFAPMAHSGPATTWTMLVKKRHGQVKESEASCDNGRFQCKGDAAWCAKQETIVCQATEHEEFAEAAEVAEAAQAVLQPEEPVEVADNSDAAFADEAEETAAQALQAAKADDHHEQAFLQQRSRVQGRLQA